MNYTTNRIKEHQKNNTLSKSAKLVKKFIAVITMAMCIMTVGAMTVFASGGASGSVDASQFINTTITVLQSVVALIGGGLAVWGVVNLIEGYGNDNAGAKSQGMKQLMAGLGLILLSIVVVPVLGTMMTNAM